MYVKVKGSLVMERKATARVPAHHPVIPRLYYERVWEAISVVIVEAREVVWSGWDPRGRLSLYGDNSLDLIGLRPGFTNQKLDEVIALTGNAPD